MNDRINISSKSPWEDKVGYSRAVKTGNQIFVSGTVSTDGKGNVVFENDYYNQTKFIFEKIEKVLIEAGATLNNVVRTRMFVVDISNWAAIGKAHLEFFNDIKPAATMVEVKKLINGKCLIEIEVDAVINN